jgi:hypothetical protein
MMELLLLLTVSEIVDFVLHSASLPGRQTLYHRLFNIEHTWHAEN